jgi:hypothetical protein
MNGRVGGCSRLLNFSTEITEDAEVAEKIFRAPSEDFRGDPVWPSSVPFLTGLNRASPSQGRFKFATLSVV